MDSHAFFNVYLGYVRIVILYANKFFFIVAPKYPKNRLFKNLDKLYLDFFFNLWVFNF